MMSVNNGYDDGDDDYATDDGDNSVMMIDEFIVTVS